VATNGFTRVLQGAGLTRSELATLYGVSRQSIHHWITVAPPRGYTARMESVITAALLTAIERKVLPFAAVSKEIRAARIARMAKTLQSLKPAPAK
jgi:hypothetical protein